MKCQCGSTEFVFSQLVHAKQDCSTASWGEAGGASWGGVYDAACVDDGFYGERDNPAGYLTDADCKKCGFNALPLAVESKFQMVDEDTLAPYDVEYLLELKNRIERERAERTVEDRARVTIKRALAVYEDFLANQDEIYPDELTVEEIHSALKEMK